MRKRTVIGGALVAAALTAAGCTNQLNDQGGVPQANPDYVLTYLNVDGFPNVTIICIRGVGFATTTRDYTALVRIPPWDAFCATQEPATPRGLSGGTTNPGETASGQ